MAYPLAQTGRGPASGNFYLFTAVFMLVLLLELDIKQTHWAYENQSSNGTNSMHTLFLLSAIRFSNRKPDAWKRWFARLAIA